MGYDEQLVLRVSRGMAKQLKQYAATLSAETGVKVSVAAAARKLLNERLTQIETSDDQGGAARPKKKR